MTNLSIDEFRKFILSKKSSTYAQFRALNTIHNYSFERNCRYEFTDEEIDNFRSVVCLLLMGLIYPKFSKYIFDHQFEQMVTEYGCWGFNSDYVKLPKNFVLHCNFMKDTRSYSRIYQWLSTICDSNIEIPAFCMVLPYLIVTGHTNYTLEQRDIVILERIAYSILTKKYVSGSKRVDILSDFMNIRNEFKTLIHLVFKDRDAESDYVVGRVVSLFREIAILWSISIMTRTKTRNDFIDNSIALFLTKKIMEYRA